MKRLRAKALGLSLALAAGTAFAAEGDWHAPGKSPAPAGTTPVGTPALLPPAVRGTPTPSEDPGPVWLPMRQAKGSPPLPAPAIAPSIPAPSGPAPSVLPAGGTPDQVVTAPVPQPSPAPAGPRIGGAEGFGPLPTIPVPSPEPSPIPPGTAPGAPVPQPESTVTQPQVAREAVLPPQAAQQVAPETPVNQQPAPLPIPKQMDATPIAPQPKAAATPPMMMPPHAPDFLPPGGKGDASPLPQPRPVDSQPLPAPRPVEAEPQPPGRPPIELQPAPAELMYPAGALEVTKHGTFGSPPIRISRDFPPMRDLMQKGHMRDGVTLPPDDGLMAEPPAPGPMNRYFVSGEYLLWWLPGFATPVLATTNANTALNGYLGEPGTTAVIGPGAFLGSTRSGLRVRAGAWFDDCGSCGIDGSFFFLGNVGGSTTINSSAVPLITRPVFAPNLVPGTSTPLGETGEAVAVPGILRGALTVQADSRLWGADVNLRKSLCTNNCNVRAEVFAGYRFLYLRESLGITEDITVIGPGGSRLNIMDPVGTHVVVHDQFTTQNYFNGGQIGGLYARQFGRWDLSARGSVALGDTHQVLQIDGFQVRQQPGAAPMIFNNGGLLAAGPNLGQFSKDRFSVVPELTLNFGYRVTNNLRVFAGYNFLLWTNVIRPGDQIDHVVDLTFVPNALPAGFSGQYRPHPLFKQRDLAINGIQFGLEWRW